MNVRMWSGTCVAIAFGVVAVVSAQGSLPPQRSRSQTSSNADTSSRSIAVIGCLQGGTTVTIGTASSSRTASAGGYLLMNATKPPSSATTAVAQYRLDADDSRLAQHLGHKVEITGTLEESATASWSSTAGSATSTAAMSAPRLKVDSVRMVSSTCP